jgi:hypothetical protein
MRNQIKPSFVRHFIGGFAIGALALVASQVAHADRGATPPAAIESAR